MSSAEQAQHVSADQRPVWLQFNLRTLVLLTACFAVLFALSAPAVRQLDYDAQVDFFAGWLVRIVGFVAAFAMIAWLRRHSLRNGGELRYRVAIIRRKLMRIIAGVVGLGLLGYLLWESANGSGHAVFSLYPQFSLMSVAWLLFVGSVLALLLASTFRELYWAEIRQHGIVVDFRLIRWEVIRKFSWMAGAPNRLALQLSDDQSIKLVVDESQREAIAALLKEAQDSNPTVTPLETCFAPLPTAGPCSPRWRVQLIIAGGLISGLIAFCGMGGMCLLIEAMDKPDRTMPGAIPFGVFSLAFGLFFGGIGLLQGLLVGSQHTQVGKQFFIDLAAAPFALLMVAGVPEVGFVLMLIVAAPGCAAGWFAADWFDVPTWVGVATGAVMMIAIANAVVIQLVREGASNRRRKDASERATLDSFEQEKTARPTAASKRKEH